MNNYGYWERVGFIQGKKGRKLRLYLIKKEYRDEYAPYYLLGWCAGIRHREKMIRELS